MVREPRSAKKRHDAIEYVIAMAMRLAGTHPGVAEHTLNIALTSLRTLGVTDEELDLAVSTTQDLLTEVRKEMKEAADRGEAGQAG